VQEIVKRHGQALEKMEQLSRLGLSNLLGGALAEVDKMADHLESFERKRRLTVEALTDIQCKTDKWHQLVKKRRLLLPSSATSRDEEVALDAQLHELWQHWRHLKLISNVIP
jgi:hypothetical protein